MSRARELGEAGSVDFLATQGRRNLIINGGFDVWQRGTSFSDGGYTADRWYARRPAQFGGTLNILKGAYSGTFFASDKVPYLFVDLLGATDDWYLSQRIEDVRTCAGKTVTVSGRMHNNVDCKIGIKVAQKFGDGANSSPTVITDIAVADREFIPANTDTEFSIKIDVPSIADKTIDGDGDTLEVLYFIYSASDGFPTDGSYRFTELQLEVGDTATPFEQRSYGEELALCQRYYWQTEKRIHLTQYESGRYVGDIFFPVVLRDTPTLTFTVSSNETVTAATPGENLNRYGCHFVTGTGSSGTAHVTGIQADAEL